MNSNENLNLNPIISGADTDAIVDAQADETTQSTVPQTPKNQSEKPTEQAQNPKNQSTDTPSLAGITDELLSLISEIRQNRSENPQRSYSREEIDAIRQQAFLEGRNDAIAELLERNRPFAPTRSRNQSAQSESTKAQTTILDYPRQSFWDAPDPAQPA